MQSKRWPVTATVVALLAGCAPPGASETGSPAPGSDTVVTVSGAASPTTVVLVPSPAPASAIPAPAPSGEASCARGATLMPSVDPSTSFDINDPQQRALRVLAEQFRPTPRRGTVPQAAVPGAEACVYVLRLQFSLLTSGFRSVPDASAIDRTLRAAGLAKIVIRPGPVFAASTGAACVYGTFTAAGPAFTIGPLGTDGSCSP
jgi:hypothetical protein